MYALSQTQISDLESKGYYWLLLKKLETDYSQKHFAGTYPIEIIPFNSVKKAFFYADIIGIKDPFILNIITDAEEFYVNYPHLSFVYNDPEV